MDKEKVSESPARVIPVDSMGITVLMGGDAKLRGSLREFFHEPHLAKRLWVGNWESPEDSFVWTVEVSKAGCYQVSMIGTGKNSEIEIIAGDSRISGWVNNGWDKMQGGKWIWDKMQGWSDKRWSDKRWRLAYMGWDRMPIGTIELPSGISTITMHAKKIGSDLALTSLELIPPAEEKTLAEKVKGIRSSARWLADAKYGVMFTWTSSSYPRHGERKPFPKNVEDFDVNAFVDMVRETGAGYVIFATTHWEHTFAAPIKAIDRILPGLTSRRDLIMEIADSLEKHGIKLMLYYHQGHGDAEWWEKTGFNKDKGKFIDNWCSIMSEVGLRYGEKLAGWFFDGNCVYYSINAPYERMAMVAKAGNPDRIICYNDAWWPKLTEFQDYHCADQYNWLRDQSHIRYLPKGGDGILTGGRQAGLQAHVCFCLEKGSGWGHSRPDTEVGPPGWEKDEFIKMIRECIERKCAISINLEVYEDGTPSPKSLELMKALRKAIRGK